MTGDGDLAAVAMVPLEGGFSGETFLGVAGAERTVVRVYARRGASRGPDAPMVDAAVLRLVRGLLPVAEVLEVRRAHPDSGAPGLLVTTLLPGTRGDLVLAGLDDRRRADLGARVAVLLARLAMMPMPRAGRFADADLRVEPWSAADLPALVAARRAGSALADWPAALYAALLEVADRAQAVLDGVRRTCLVHGDLNPKNLLVDPRTLEVTGLVDWEFACAGPPGADLGNLLRFERDPRAGDDFAAGVVEGYRARVPDASPALLDQARAADLAALVDLAARRGQNPVTERAHELLVAVARSGDLHVRPPE